GLAGIPSSTGKDGPYINGKLKFGRILVRNLHPEPRPYETVTLEEAQGK
ncbi:modification methylase, partial [Bifidobacterium bifidum]